MSSLPLVLLVVPLGGEALHRVHPHVQHPLDLLGLPVWVEGPGPLGVNWEGGGGRGGRFLFVKSVGWTLTLINVENLPF